MANCDRQNADFVVIATLEMISNFSFLPPQTKETTLSEFFFFFLLK